MAERSGDRLLVTGVTQHELEFALGFIGLSDYKVEQVTEPVSLGLATIEELKEFAKQVGANPQLATRLNRRVREFYPHLITDNGSISIDGLSEAIKNADRYFAEGKKTIEFAQSFIDSKTTKPGTD